LFIIKRKWKRTSERARFAQVAEWRSRRRGQGGAAQIRNYFQVRLGIRRSDSNLEFTVLRQPIHIGQLIFVMGQQVAPEHHALPVRIAPQYPQPTQSMSCRRFVPSEDAISDKKEILAKTPRQEGRPKRFGLDHGDGQEAESFMNVQRET